MQKEDGLKKSIADIVQKIVLKPPQKSETRSLADKAHFLTSRAAFSVLPLLGICLSISCAIWDGALDSSPQEHAQWTMPSLQGLRKGKGSLPDTAPRPSFCYFLPLGNTWREGRGVCLAQERSGLPSHSC